MTKTKFLGLKKPAGKDYFNVEDFNENAEIIDEAFEDGSAKIGDIRISARDFTDDSWLLCPNTDVNEDNYPELYYILAAKTDIFTGEWASATGINTHGVAPIFAVDSEGNEYVYFVSSSQSTVYRYNPDLTEMHTFERLKTGAVQYENGLWFIFDSSNFGTVYYSSDCFETDIQTLVIASLSSKYSSPTTSSVRFTNGTWLFTFRYSDDDYRPYLYVSETDSISSTYSSGYSYYDDHYGERFYCTDRITLANGATIALFTRNYSLPTDRYVTNLYYIPSWKNSAKSEWVELFKYMSFDATIDYIPEIDAVTCGTSIIKNDGTILDIDLSGAVYFKGFIYKPSTNAVYRYDANALEEEPVIKTKYVTGGVSASSLRLYMPNGTDSVYYIENDKSLSIPEAHPDSIFKTYIKAK